MLAESRTFRIVTPITSEGLVSLLSSSLITDGLAKKSYQAAVLEREREHPTGIDCGSYAIATPHTDSIHANKPGLAVAALHTDVIFMNADKSGQELKPRVVVMICIPPSEGGKEHIETIGRIYKIAGCGEILDRLSQANSASEVTRVFMKHF